MGGVKGYRVVIAIESLTGEKELLSPSNRQARRCLEEPGQRVGVIGVIDGGGHGVREIKFIR